MLSDPCLGQQACVDGYENICGILESADEENVFLKIGENEIALPLKSINSIYWYKKEDFTDTAFSKSIERIKRKTRIIYCCMIFLGTILGILLGVVT